MNSIHFFIFMIFPTFLLGNESEKIENKLNKAWNSIHEMPGHKTSLWNKWFCKENSESKCQKICAKCQEHNAECHNAKCKENCANCQKHRRQCHFEACREHLNECHEWRKIAEKILGLLLRWDELKKRAKLSADNQIEEASKNRNCDGKCKKQIEDKWHKSLIGTLLNVNANDYMVFIQKNNDHVGTSADAPIALSLHLALKTVEQEEDESLYFEQMNKWDSWLTGSTGGSVEEELSNNGTTDADDSPKMAQTSAMDIKNLAPRK